VPRALTIAATQLGDVQVGNEAVTGQHAATVAARALEVCGEGVLVVGLAMDLQFFEQGGFERGFHADQRIVAQVRGQGVGQVGLKAGDPDAVNLLFHLCNRRHGTLIIINIRICPSVYLRCTRTGERIRHSSSVLRTAKTG